MHIVLSQRFNRDSGYKDELFHRYHFPRHYRNQLRPGDLFVYYQGNRFRQADRVYFGTGVVGEVYPDPDMPHHYYAELIDATEFSHHVPIYTTDGTYYESLGFEEVRKQPIPSWQNSIRRISPQGFTAILHAADFTLLAESMAEVAVATAETDILAALHRLNTHYAEATPSRKERVINQYLDRGTAVTNALKQLLRPICQICGQEGFRKRSGQPYIEAHHMIQVAQESSGSLCSDNIILVCPTCHRKLHHAAASYSSTDTSIIIQINDDPPVTIQRNRMEYLVKILQHTCQQAAEIAASKQDSTR